MTKEEVYDLACKRFIDPAVFTFGGECVLGYWVLKSEAQGQALMLESRSKRHGVVLVARATTWEALAAEIHLPDVRATSVVNGKRASR